jgi:vitamin B12 transporter
LKQVLGIFILIILSFSVFAQTDTLKEHIVLEKIISIPSKTYSFKTIDSINIIGCNNSTIDNVLSKNSGVFVKQYGSGNLATISIRGAGANQTQIYWNDIPINSATLGMTDLSLFPSNFYNKILIQTGGAGLSSGFGGIGGSLRLFSSNPKDYINSISFNQTIGSFGKLQSSINTNYNFKKISSITGYSISNSNNDFLYYDTSTPEETYKTRENASVKQNNLFHKSSINFNNYNSVNFILNYTDSYRQIPSIIGATSRGEYQIDKQFRSKLNYKHISNNWIHNFNLAFTNEIMNYIDTIANINSHIEVDSKHLNYNTARYFSKNKGKLQIYLMNRLDIAKSYYYINEAKQLISSAYVKWEQTKSDFIYHIAFRQELINNKFAPISPSIGIKKEFCNDIFSSSINASKSSRYPSLNDKYWIPGGNIDLLPEIGFEIENSNSFNFIKKLPITISAYYGITDNLIQWAPHSSGMWSPQNIKQVIRYGLETSAKISKRINSYNIFITIQYNYNISSASKSELSNDASIGKQLMYIPLHQAHCNISISKKNLSFYYNQTLTGRVYIDNNNNFYLPYYIPADIGLDWKIKTITDITIGARINNLYNENYQVISYRPMPRINFLLNLKININQKNE